VTQTRINQTLCEARGAVLIVAPRYAAFALNERYVLWDSFGY
jgi:hypothetical protein